MSGWTPYFISRFRRFGPLTILMLATFSACQHHSGSNPELIDSAPLPVTATQYVGAASTFNLPDPIASTTPRTDLFRLVDALDKAYALMDFSTPYPGIRIVDADHPMLEDGAVGSATINDKGQEHLYFSRDYLAMGAPLAPLVIHELAHLQAWRIHGVNIAPHGREFKKICRAATARSHCVAVRR